MAILTDMKTIYNSTFESTACYFFTMAKSTSTRIPPVRILVIIAYNFLPRVVVFATSVMFRKKLMARKGTPSMADITKPPSPPGPKRLEISAMTISTRTMAL